MPGVEALVVTTISGAVVVGMILPLLAVLEPALARRLGKQDGRVGGLRLVSSVALVPALLLSGLLVEWRGAQEGLILGTLAAALGLASLGLSRTHRTALLSAVLIGAALALTQVATVVLMVAAFEGGDQPATATNLGYLVVGAAALAMSGLIPWLERKLGLRQGLLLLALLCLFPAAAAGLTAGEDFQKLAVPAAVREGGLDLKLLLAGLVLFLYWPLEHVLTAWAPPYLAEVGHDSRALPMLFVGFWIAFLSARFLAALLPAGFMPWLVLLLALLAAATVGNLIGIFRPVAGALGFWTLGACLGPIFPTVVGVVLELFPHHQPLACGTLLAIGSVGGLVLQPALETVIRRRPVRTAMRLVMLTALVAAAPALVLCLVT